MPRSRSKPGARAWYAGGLRFRCVADCGACCTRHGEHAYVYLEKDDAYRLSRFLGMSPSSFLEAYTELDDGLRILRMDQDDCPFLDGTACRVYPARPIQCRTFPFWEENLGSPEAWEALREFCPGIGTGRRHPPEEIETFLAIRSAGGGEAWPPPKNH